MQRRMLCILCILFSMVWLSLTGHACSTFCLMHGDQPLFGRNYDWMVGEGMVIVNKRHVAKTAMGSTHPARWTSTYGSVTFNQYGRELPMGGMNEAGLVMATLWLKDAEYAVPDDRPAVNTLQWIQYQLDTAHTVDEVIASDAHVRVSPGGSAKVHYLVCDRLGVCSSIEFLGGKLVAHTKDSMAVKALTNNTYTQSVAFLQRYQGFGGPEPLPTSRGSLDRFARAASRVTHYNPQTSPSAVDAAFAILAEVAQGTYTKWSMVYDLHHRRIYFRTLANPHRRSIEVDALDFSCTTPVQVLNLNAAGAGDMTQEFQAYSEQSNRHLLGNAFRKTPFLADTPSHVLDAIAHYPTTTVCRQPAEPATRGLLRGQAPRNH